MPLVAAVEPNPEQAARVSSVVQELVGAELVVEATAQGVLASLGPRVPDLVLISPLLAPAQETLIAERLRHLQKGGTRIPILVIPLLAAPEPPKPDALLSRLRRPSSSGPSDGVPFEAFAGELRHYLEQVATQSKRARPADGEQVRPSPGVPVS